NKCSVAFCISFFFFQAEDGIRDFHVTGVQTCALPIWNWAMKLLLDWSSVELARHLGRRPARFQWRAREKRNLMRQALALGIISRSEERRVGKKWVIRWLTYKMEGNEHKI